MYKRNITDVRQESNWICECKKLQKLQKIDLFSKIPKIKHYQ